MDKIKYIEKDSKRILKEVPYKELYKLPNKFDYVNIDNVRWCVYCREFTETRKFGRESIEIIIWLYDDTKLY